MHGAARLWPPMSVPHRVSSRNASSIDAPDWSAPDESAVVKPQPEASSEVGGIARGELCLEPRSILRPLKVSIMTVEHNATRRLFAVASICPSAVGWRETTHGAAPDQSAEYGPILRASFVSCTCVLNRIVLRFKDRLVLFYCTVNTKLLPRTCVVKHRRSNWHTLMKTLSQLFFFSFASFASAQRSSNLDRFRGVEAESPNLQTRDVLHAAGHVGTACAI